MFSLSFSPFLIRWKFKYEHNTVILNCIKKHKPRLWKYLTWRLHEYCNWQAKIDDKYKDRLYHRSVRYQNFVMFFSLKWLFLMKSKTRNICIKESMNSSKRVTRVQEKSQSPIYVISDFLTEIYNIRENGNVR